VANSSWPSRAHCSGGWHGDQRCLSASGHRGHHAGVYDSSQPDDLPGPTGLQTGEMASRDSGDEECIYTFQLWSAQLRWHEVSCLALDCDPMMTIKQPRMERDAAGTGRTDPKVRDTSASKHQRRHYGTCRTLFRRAQVSRVYSPALMRYADVPKRSMQCQLQLKPVTS